MEEKSRGVRKERDSSNLKMMVSLVKFREMCDDVSNHIVRAPPRVLEGACAGEVP